MAKIPMSPLPRVPNIDAEFGWIPGGETLWYRHQNLDTDEVRLLDASTDEERPLFTVEALRGALGDAWPGGGIIPSGSTAGWAGPLPRLRILPGGASLVAETAKGPFECALPLQGRTPAPGADMMLSPDRQRAVVRHDDDLWLRDVASGFETRLTSDGEQDFGYGDTDNYEDTLKVSRRRNGLPKPLLGVHWSPSGRYVIALRQDLRPYPLRLLATEYIGADADFGIVHQERVAAPGDAQRPDSRLVIIDTFATSLTVVDVAIDPQALNDYALGYFKSGQLWWTSDERSLFLIGANRGGTRYALHAIETDSGASREILHEQGTLSLRLNTLDYGRPNVAVLPDGAEVIWYSERSGFGHLYLHDVRSGTVKRAITGGASWGVFDLLHVDPANRVIYFTAGGLHDPGNPYWAALYRIGLDGGEPELLTPEPGHHDFPNGYGAFSMPPGERSFSSSGLHFVDSVSSADWPMRTLLRKADGDIVKALAEADATALFATGWRPPERVVVKAADGETDLHGLIFTPPDFDPARRYPVIDMMYPGPQMAIVPQRFGDVVRVRASTFAEAGFVVVVVDGRGTAYRSRVFREAFLGTEDLLGAADHAAAIRNLARDRPYMDLERVGVIGASFGGFGSLRTMLLHPDLFKVCVSCVGPGDWFHVTQSVSAERFLGVPGSSADARAKYDLFDNLHLVDRMTGRLLLIYGGLDENVPAANAFVVIDAFVKADKDIDMLIIPDAAHGVPGMPYAERRTIQYFTEHLLEGRS